MDFRRFAFFVLIFSLTVSVRAEEDTTRYTITSIFMGGQSPYFSNRSISVHDIRRLTLSSSMLNRDLSGYRYMSYSEQENARFLLGLTANRPIRNGDRYFISFRLGFTYSSTTPLYAAFSKTDSIPFDTLTSSQTGNIIYVKKVNSDYYNANYQTDRLGINAGALIGTSPLRRFSFYTGLGLHYELVLNASTHIYHSAYTEYKPYGIYNSTSDYHYLPVEEEIIKNRSGYSMMIYVPIGCQFRVGKKAAFWKRLYAYYEFTLGMYSEEIPELGTLTGFSPGFSGGYRYYFGKME
jgi:hypothetical protein